MYISWHETVSCDNGKYSPTVTNMPEKITLYTAKVRMFTSTRFRLGTNYGSYTRSVRTLTGYTTPSFRMGVLS